MKLGQFELNVINNSVGSVLLNYEGEMMGFIAGVVNINKQQNSEYIILGSDYLFGSATRYFAIPACIQMIGISGENIWIKINKEDLMQAKRISFDECPRPLYDLEPLIYEITDFRRAEHQHHSFRRAKSNHRRRPVQKSGNL